MNLQEMCRASAVFEQFLGNGGCINRAVEQCPEMGGVICCSVKANANTEVRGSANSENRDTGDCRGMASTVIGDPKRSGQYAGYCLLPRPPSRGRRGQFIIAQFLGTSRAGREISANLAYLSA